MTTTLRPVTLDPALARRIEKAARKVASDTARREASVRDRDELVLEAIRDGASLREIAAFAGLSHVAVKNIADKGKTP